MHGLGFTMTVIYVFVEPGGKVNGKDFSKHTWCSIRGNCSFLISEGLCFLWEMSGGEK